MLTLANRKKSRLLRLICVSLILVLVLSLGISTALAAATAIHLKKVPTSAVSVTIEVGDDSINMIKQAPGFWKTPDGGSYVSDDIKGVWVDSIWYPRSSLKFGVEAGGTINIDLGEALTPESTYEIITSVTNGTITPNVYDIPEGEDRTINYSATPGFILYSVTVDGVPKDITTYPTSYSFTNIQDDHAIAVVYAADTRPEGTFNITTSVVGGTIDANMLDIPEGENRTVNYSPSPGNYLVSVKVDGAPVDIATYPSSYTFTNIQADHTIHVVYEGNIVTDTNLDLLLIICGAMLLAGGLLIVLSRLKRKVTE